MSTFLQDHYAVHFLVVFTVSVSSIFDVLSSIEREEGRRRVSHLEWMIKRAKWGEGGYLGLGT